MFVGVVDTHILLPCPYQMLFGRYNNHASLHSFYMSQRYDWPFHRTFCFASFCFGIKFSVNDLAMIININAYFWQILNTHNHILSCTVQTSPSVGVAEFYVE